MLNDRALQKLISELAEAKREYDLLAFDEDQHRTLHPPASPDQIARLERLVGKPLPPSYRAFLALHNGWTDFTGEASLLAVEDHGTDWVNERIAYWSDLFDDDRENPFEQGAIPILLGEKENHFLVLDPRKMRDNGEMDFVDYDYAHEHRRFEDFTSFLRHELKIMRGLIDRERNGVPDDGDGDEEE